MDEPIRYNEGKVDWTLLPWDEEMIKVLSLNLNQLKVLNEEEIETILVQYLIRKDVSYCLAASLSLVGMHPKEYNLANLPWDALEQVCRVFSFGAQKYTRDNYKLAPGLPLDNYIQSMWRHLVQYLKGEEVDSESQLPHLAHLACNAFMYLWTVKNYGS